MRAEELIEMIEAGKRDLPSADKVQMSERNYWKLEDYMKTDRFRGQTLCDLEVEVVPGMESKKVYVTE